MITIRKSAYWICLVSVILSSCATNVNRGHMKEDEALTNIKIGTTTKAEVMKQLGSPSSESSFGDKTWCYVSIIKQTRSILPPKIIDEHTIEIRFDSNDVVSSIKEYGLKDSKDVEIVKRATPTEGQELGFFEQIFANLGRFNKNDNANGVMNDHGGHGLPSPNGYPGGR